MKSSAAGVTAAGLSLRPARARSAPSRGRVSSERIKLAKLRSSGCALWSGVGCATRERRIATEHNAQPQLGSRLASDGRALAARESSCLLAETTSDASRIACD